MITEDVMSSWQRMAATISLQQKLLMMQQSMLEPPSFQLSSFISAMPRPPPVNILGNFPFGFLNAPMFWQQYLRSMAMGIIPQNPESPSGIKLFEHLSIHINMYFKLQFGIEHRHLQWKSNRFIAKNAQNYFLP